MRQELEALAALLQTGGAEALRLAATVAPDPVRSFRPGYYRAIQGDDSLPNDERLPAVLKGLEALKADPEHIVGAHICIGWGTFEPKRHVYDHRLVRAFLDGLQEQGRAGIVSLRYRNFRSTPNQECPDYLTPVAYKLADGVPLGWQAPIHEVEACNAFCEHIQRFRAEYDRHPALEGVDTTESAIGLELKATAPDMFESLRVIYAGLATFQFTQPFANLNSFPMLADLMQMARDMGLGYSSTDARDTLATAIMPPWGPHLAVASHPVLRDYGIDKTLTWARARGVTHLALTPGDDWSAVVDATAKTSL